MSIFNRNSQEKNKINTKHKQTFTYFIPSPPERSTPYQEKAFDQVTSFLNRNGICFKISNTPSNSKGVWIILELFGDNTTLNKIIAELQDNLSSKVNTEADHDLEIYYEDHEEFHKDDNFEA